MLVHFHLAGSEAEVQLLSDTRHPARYGHGHSSQTARVIQLPRQGKYARALAPGTALMPVIRLVVGVRYVRL